MSCCKVTRKRNEKELVRESVSLSQLRIVARILAELSVVMSSRFRSRH
jgi:hypothetical protein